MNDKEIIIYDEDDMSSYYDFNLLDLLDDNDDSYYNSWENENNSSRELY